MWLAVLRVGIRAEFDDPGGIFQPQGSWNSAQLEATAPGFHPRQRGISKGCGQNSQESEAGMGLELSAILVWGERDLGEGKFMAGKKENNSSREGQGMRERREKGERREKQERREKRESRA